jgi:PAS domain-containing protein/DNA-binding CsgD family transcriptional regulator
MTMQPNFQSPELTKINEQHTAVFAGFEHIEVCMMGLMPDGKIIYVNQPTCDLLECSKDELVGASIQTVAPEMTSDAWSAFWSEIDRKGTSENHILLIRMSTHEGFQAKARVLLVEGAGQKGCVMFLARPKKIAIPTIDIQTYKAQFIHILDAIANPVISMDRQHKFTFLNQAACRTFSTTVAEATGKTVYDYLPKKSADIFWEKEQEVLDTGRTTIFVGDGFIKATYGESFTLLPFYDISLKQNRLLAIINKPPVAVERTTLLLEPHETEPVPGRTHFLPELRRYMDKGAIGIYLKDPDNRIVWVNQSYATMIGFEPKDLIGKRVDDVINDPELLAVLRKEDESVYATGRPVLNLLKQPERANKKLIRIDKIPFIDRNRKITGIIGLAVEIDAPPLEVEALQEKIHSTSRKLADTETALRVLLEHREKDVSLSKDKLADKIKTLVLPYLESLKQTKLQPDQIEFIALIEDNLKNFYDHNYAKLSAPEHKLSPNEVKVAQLVRDGKTNKEIAKMLHLSKSTILTHRHHVRVKLGIRNKKVNLRSLLKS